MSLIKQGQSVQLGDFFAQVDDRESNRVHLDVGGVTVLINATGEGVIVDVISQAPAEDGEDVLATLCCEYPSAEN